MKLPNVDALQKTLLRFHSECAIICGAAALVAIYAFSLNRNVLYLSLLGATYILFSALFTRFRFTLIGLAILVILAATPADVPKTIFVKPDDGRQFVNGYFYNQPKPAEQWQYTFHVENLAAHQRECGGNLTGNLIVNGFNLNGFIVTLEGQALPAMQVTTLKKSKAAVTVEQALIPLDKNILGNFTVSFQLKPTASSWIFIGPETDGLDIYSDAVWIEFKNEQCSVLYHAQRQTLPSK